MGQRPGKDRGRGIAFTLSFGVPVAEVVEVTNTPRGIKIDRVFVAVDVGKVLDPENFENQVQGGVIWGLGHAINCRIDLCGRRSRADKLSCLTKACVSTKRR